MSVQNPTIPGALEAKGIDAAIIDLQTFLSFELTWLSNGMGRAYKRKKVRPNQAVQFLPMVYLGTSKYDFFDASPDNDKEGQSIILVGNRTPIDFQRGHYGYSEYPVSLIFSANLETINPILLLTEDFTEHLMDNVRQALTRDILGKSYDLEILEETRDFDEVYAEFDINTDAGKTNKPLLPMTYFRFDTTITIKEDCPSIPLDRCTAIQNNLTQDDIDNCIIPNYCGGGFSNTYSMAFDGVNEELEAPTNAIYDIERTDSFTICCRVNVASFAAVQQFIAKHLGGRGWYFGVVGARLILALEHAGGAMSNKLQVRTVASLTAGVSYHVAVTYDGTSTPGGIKFYIDGVLQSNVTLLNNLSMTITNVFPVIIGGPINIDATINVVRMWDIEFTQAQITSDYNAGTPTDPIQQVNQIIGCDMGDNGLFGVDTWVLPDTTGNVTGFQSNNMEFLDRVAAI